MRLKSVARRRRHERCGSRWSRPPIEELFGPLDRQDAVLPKLVEPELVDLTRVVQAIEVDVKQRQTSATVLLHQRERRAADVFRLNTQPLGQAAHQRGLPCSEIADQQEHRSRLERRCELAAHVSGLVLGVRRDRHASTIRKPIAPPPASCAKP